MGIISWLRGGAVTLDGSELAPYGRFGVGRDLKALPRTIVKDLDAFGRFWIRRNEATTAAESKALDLCADLDLFATTQPERFRREVRAAVRPVGGWAEYGAIRLISELLGRVDDPDSDYLMESSLAFLRSRQIPWANLSTDAHAWWALNLPGVEWLPQQAPPARDVARIHDIPAGKERMVARVDFNGSEFFVCNEHGTYVAYQRYAGPDELSGPIEFADASARDLYDLYVKVGRGFGSVPDWVDEELEPFVTVQRGDFS